MSFASVWNIYGENHDLKFVVKDKESRPIRYKPTAETKIKRHRR